jgi:hypothetical protein
MTAKTRKERENARKEHLEQQGSIILYKNDLYIGDIVKKENMVTKQSRYFAIIGVMFVCDGSNTEPRYLILGLELSNSGEIEEGLQPTALNEDSIIRFKISKANIRYKKSQLKPIWLFVDKPATRDLDEELSCLSAEERKSIKYRIIERAQRKYLNDVRRYHGDPPKDDDDDYDHDVADLKLEDYL